MQNLRPDQSFPIHMRAFRFVTIRLRSRPQTKALAAETQVQRDALKAAGEAYDEAVEERVAATAEVEYVDSVLDVSVLDLSRELLALNGGDRQDPRFTKLFPVAPAETVRPVTTEGQNRAVRVIVELLKEDPNLAPLRHHAASIGEKLANLEAALKARDGRYVDEDKANANRRQVMDHARRMYRMLMPRLQLIFPNDPVLVESFFLTLSATNKREDPTE